MYAGMLTKQASRIPKLLSYWFLHNIQEHLKGQEVLGFWIEGSLQGGVNKRFLPEKDMLNAS